VTRQPDGRHGKIPALGGEIPIGKFFERTDVSTLHGTEPGLNEGWLVQRDPRVPLDVARPFVEEFM
jgi:2-oxoglutarate ferredoxin oxidoreductase subunit beta